MNLQPSGYEGDLFGDFDGGLNIESFGIVNRNDIMSSWIRFREDELLYRLNEDDRRHMIQFE